MSAHVSVEAINELLKEGKPIGALINNLERGGGCLLALKSNHYDIVV